MDTTYPRKPVITDTSLEDANRIIFSPWDTISGYEDPVTDNVIDIPGNIAVLSIPEAVADVAKETTTSSMPRIEQIANKFNISDEEKSNKSSSYSQLVIRVQSVHFHKVSYFLVAILLHEILYFNKVCVFIYFLRFYIGYETFKFKYKTKIQNL